MLLISLHKEKKGGGEKMGGVSDDERGAAGRSNAFCTYLVLGGEEEGVAIDDRPSLPAASNGRRGY